MALSNATVEHEATAANDEIEHIYPLVREYFPRAEHVGPFGGEPRAAPVFADDDETIGYVYLTDQILPIPAYSGKPISTLVALDMHGTIIGVRIVHHEEPILLAGVSEAQLAAYVQQYRGINARERIKVGGTARAGYATVDAISGATITVMVINQTISKTLQQVASARGLLDGSAQRSMATTSHDSLSIWRMVWHERMFRIGVLVAALIVLTLILLFQDWLARHPRLLLYVRDGYLVFTVIFIGWYALAQLSVINVLTFVHAMMHDFRWETFLIDPLMFILWGFVAITLLLWGRGVYCGWLCPFGALQELINQTARKLNVRQWEFPEVVHERLWALKYVILLLLFGVSLQSLESAERYAEIEPFKTAMTLRFQREWAYVVYAIALLAISAVNRKFYCKYLCPLGAALAIPARQRLFDWLRRRKECGKPCQICANECEVRAINATGEINANECHYCLDCQVTYWNDNKCPPLVQRRKRREKGGRARELAEEMVLSFRAQQQDVDPGVVHGDEDTTGSDEAKG
ncbi:MAG: 4Fe-4S binding protein [Gammaproteobacteria bacterium]|nr:4Fe-4S binding protein [Gammaproteobacteria bacterium]